MKEVKILICDDSMLVRKKLKELLCELGCEVYEAKNGQQAYLEYLANKPDAVFMDVVMPEVDGLEALNKIREYDPTAKIYMLSSTGTSEKLITALKLGAADFIQKPYTKDQIEKIIGRISG